MKFRKLALAAAAVVPFVTGCAEEGADGFEATYPVGAEAPSRADVSVAGQPGTATPPSAAPESGAYATDSGDVAIGADDAQSDQYDDADPAALSDFRPALDPYGTWVDDTTYGTAWVPSASVVGSDFTPYQTAGHWVYDDDYVWVSDYDWGWAPFHYGRWVFAEPYGWEWIPGRRYAGAWVSWRYGWGDWGYVGWAPLGPTWCWRDRVAVGIGYVPRTPYAFVSTHELFEPHVGARIVTGDRVGAIAAHTRPWISASPAVAGRVAARPAVSGPPPSTLQIPASAVVGGNINRGVVQARAFARPSTALAMGAAAPRAWSARPITSGDVGLRGPATTPSASVSHLGTPSYGVRTPYGAPAYASEAARPVAPASGSPAPSHFGGRLGGGFVGVPAAGPTFAPSAAARPYFATPSPSVAAPSYRTGVGSPSAPPTFRSGPSYAAPSFRSPPSVSTPAFRSAPSFATPSFRSAPSAAPSGGFHGGGGYSGGFHGGGGGGSGGGGFRGGGGGGGRGGGHR